MHGLHGERMFNFDRSIDETTQNRIQRYYGVAASFWQLIRHFQTIYKKNSVIMHDVEFWTPLQPPLASPAQGRRTGPGNKNGGGGGGGGSDL